MQITPYVRHRTGEDRRTKPGRFKELSFDDALTGFVCPECDKPLRAGQRPSLFAVGPASVRDGTAADQGGWYVALAVTMHETCAWGGANDQPPQGS